MEQPFLRFAHGEAIDMLRDSVRGFAAKEVATAGLARAGVENRAPVPAKSGALYSSIASTAATSCSLLG